MSELRAENAKRWDLDKIFREKGYPNPFPGKITFADVDFETEIKSHFLVLEGKRKGQSLETGQKLAMDARCKDGRTCVVFYGNPDTGEISEMQIWPNERQPANRKILWDFINQWAKWAKAQTPPEPRYSTFLFYPRKLSNLQETEQ
jgi:hypothetical protein